jgi:hypothetical protein
MPARDETVSDLRTVAGEVVHDDWEIEGECRRSHPPEVIDISEGVMQEHPVGFFRRLAPERLPSVFDIQIYQVAERAFGGGVCIQVERGAPIAAAKAVHRSSAWLRSIIISTQYIQHTQEPIRR